MMIDRRLLIASGLSLLATPALAQLEALPYADRQQVDKAAAYLQAMTTVKGRFVQTNSRGASSQGNVYISRPGKARFEYDPPAQMLLVSNGRNVSIYDRRLKTFDRYPLGATPLGIFLSRRINLREEVRVTRLARSADGFQIFLSDARNQADGRLVLNFAAEPMALQGWTVVDGQGVETRVVLSDVQMGVSLDPALFVITDPTRAAAPEAH